jgi:glutamate 5-kinase
VKTTNAASRQFLRKRRVVIKVGSALLVDAASGRVNRHWLQSLAQDIRAARARSQEIVIVTSGAIALGKRKLGLPLTKHLSLAEAQAAASVGQIALAQVWAEVLSEQQLSVGQVLLTLEDTEARTRYLNARATLNTLLAWQSIPIINENDTVATAEIRYGDNDRLAARVAQMLSADALILLSDIDGVYTEDPHRSTTAEWLPIIPSIDAAILALAGPSHSRVGTGGMASKVAAAQIATAAGCEVCITQGKRLHPLSALIAGERASWFLANLRPKAARKLWIQGSLRPKGKVFIDAGAYAALKRGRSLLPAGIVKVTGQFNRGDTVAVYHEQQEIARGLTTVERAEADLIIGKRSTRRLDNPADPKPIEFIHRDDLVLMSE